jgi:LysM repeat protein
MKNKTEIASVVVLVALLIGTSALGSYITRQPTPKTIVETVYVTVPPEIIYITEETVTETTTETTTEQIETYIGAFEYLVEPNDTLWWIASRLTNRNYDLSRVITDIMQLNNLPNATLYAGDTILLPLYEYSPEPPDWAKEDTE